MDRTQRYAFGRESFVHATGMAQRAAQIVGPLVIRADAGGNPSLLRGTDARASVAARIVIGADLVIAVTHDDDRGRADFDGEEAAGLGNLADRSGEKPTPVEDGLQIEREEAGVVVERLGQRVALAPLA